jgi:hypothetical protein
VRVSGLWCTGFGGCWVSGARLSIPKTPPPISTKPQEGEEMRGGARGAPGAIRAAASDPVLVNHRCARRHVVQERCVQPRGCASRASVSSRRWLMYADVVSARARPRQWQTIIASPSDGRAPRAGRSPPRTGPRRLPRARRPWRRSPQAGSDRRAAPRRREPGASSGDRPRTRFSAPIGWRCPDGTARWPSRYGRARAL